jgi:hypothetical protein
MHTGDEQHRDIRRRAARAVVCTLGPPPEGVRAPGYRRMTYQRVVEPLRFGRRLRGLERAQERRKRRRHRAVGGANSQLTLLPYQSLHSRNDIYIDVAGLGLVTRRGALLRAVDLIRQLLKGLQATAPRRLCISHIREI